jgi:acyl-CoA dehydrogenase
VVEEKTPASLAPIDRAGEIATTTVRQWAFAVDDENRFPTESVAALRDAGLLGYFVPRDLGGLGGDVGTYCRIAQLLGRECVSTAIVWAMHANQVATLADHGSPAHRPHLREIAERGSLIASVIAEYGRGGDVLKADTPLRPENGNLRIERRAPFVSYGAEAGLYLVTMRAGEDRPSNDGRLVLVRPEDGTVMVTGEWDAMGVRGTRTVGMEFDVLVEPARIVGDSLRPVAVSTLIPVAMMGWSAAWIGAAAAAFDRLVHQERRSGSRNWDSDLFLTRLADVRLRLDLVESLLLRLASRMDELRAAGAPADAYEDPAHSILVNNLKIASSRFSFSVADDLMTLAGPGRGYLRSDPGRLERVFRDLRSAAMMYGNDRLLLSNGRLIMVEGLPVNRIWSRPPRG